jgi:4-hydroxyproline epimerase
MDVVHPLDANIRGVKHCMWTGQPTQPGSDGRSVVIAGKSLVDRSPCGTGTSARMAQRVARGRQEIGARYVHESVIGSQFAGCATSTTRIGELDAIIPTVEGSAWITGLNTLFVNEGEPFPEGFRV